MKLSAILQNIPHFWLQQAADPDCSDLCLDSRRVRPGSVFVCLKGEQTDGRRFAEEAVSRGAAALVCDAPLSLTSLPARIPVVRVANGRRALALMAGNFYGHPDRKLCLIGVTGTNGKSTSVTFLKAILEEAGHRTGLIGTIECCTGRRRIPSTMTTPEAPDLQALFAEMVEAGCTHCVMEVSSHALAQQRVYGLNFAVGIFTNLTRDHLQFHHTFEQYYQAKFQLLCQSDCAVLQVDDLYGRRMANELREQGKNLTTVGISRQAHFRGTLLSMDLDGSRFSCNGEPYSIALPGAYNVSNALGCIAATRLLGIPAAVIRRALKQQTVRGRFEAVLPQLLPFRVIIDFAHTPDALEKILETLRPLTPGRLIAVYGSGGDPDPIKRAELGRIGTLLADAVIFTSDNPKAENPLQILREVEQGAVRSNYRVVPDRETAILEALSAAAPGDVVLLAGKGHETYQLTAAGKVPFEERRVVEAFLAQQAVVR